MPLEGGGLTGIPESACRTCPIPKPSSCMGDFNMLPGSPEYVELVGRPDHEFGMPLTADLAVDVAQRLDTPDLVTWVDPDRPAGCKPPQTHRLRLHLEPRSPDR